MNPQLLIVVLDAPETTAPTADATAVAPAAPSTPPSLHWRFEAGDADAIEGDDAEQLEALLDAQVPDREALRVDLVPATAQGFGCRVNLPPRSQRRLAQLLPFLVEEYVTGNIEDFHLVAGRPQGQRVSVAAFPRETVRSWTRLLEPLGLQPDTIRPLQVLLEEPGDDVISLFAFAGHDFVAGPAGAFHADPDWRQLALEATLEAEDGVQRLQLGGVATDDPAITAVAVASSVEVVALEMPEGPLGWIAARCRGSAGIDLRQGEFTLKKRAQTSAVSARFGLVALLLLWFGLESSLALAEGLWLSNRADATRAASVSLYRELFPQAQQVRNPLRQMRQNLGSAAAGEGADPGALELLGALAEHTRQARWMSLNYNQQRGEMNAELRVPGLAQLEAIKAGLEAAGLEAEIVSAVQGGAEFSARVRVRAAAGGAS